MITDKKSNIQNLFLLSEKVFPETFNKFRMNGNTIDKLEVNNMENSYQKNYKKGFIPYALGAFLVGIVGGFVTVLGPAFVKDLNLPYNNTTWTALAMAISTAAGAPILGKLGDLIGRRTTLLSGINTFIRYCYAR